MENYQAFQLLPTLEQAVLAQITDEKLSTTQQRGRQRLKGDFKLEDIEYVVVDSEDNIGIDTRLVVIGTTIDRMLYVRALRDYEVIFNERHTTRISELEREIDRIKITSMAPKDYVPANELSKILEEKMNAYQKLEAETRSIVYEDQEGFQIYNIKLEETGARLKSLIDKNKRRTELLAEISGAPLRMRKNTDAERRVKEQYPPLKEYAIATCSGRTYTMWVAYLLRDDLPFVVYNGAGVLYPTDDDVPNDILNPKDFLAIGRKKREPFLIREHKRNMPIRENFA